MPEKNKPDPLAAFKKTPFISVLRKIGGLVSAPAGAGEAGTVFKAGPTKPAIDLRGKIKLPGGDDAINRQKRK